MKNSLIYIGLATAISFVLLFIVSLFASPLVVELFFLFLVFWCGLFFYKNYPDEVFGKILLFGLFLRSGLALFQRFVGNLPDSTADAQSFQRVASEFATAWLNGLETASYSGAYYYSKMIAGVYYFVGEAPLIAQLLNVILGTLLIFIGYKTVLVLFESKKGARICAFIIALFPVLNLYSAITMREAVIVFFLAFSFYFFSLWIKKGELKNIILSLSTIFISSIFHGGVFPIGLIYLFVFSFYFPKEKKWRFLSRSLFIGFLIALIYSFLFFAFFQSKIPFFTDIDPERMERVAESRSTGRTAYLEGMKTENTFDAVWQTPVRVAYFYLAPFPWEVESWKDVGGVFDISLYILLFFFSVSTLRKLKKEDRALFIAIILIILAFSVVFAWGTSNYGTAFRHRAKIVFLLIVTASYSLSLVNWRRVIKKCQKGLLKN
jgi:4-amino-4-deoxy-L-arabinose transferase-like glycosyltransferase